MKVVSGTVDFSSRPRMIRCYFCGKEYGSKSISIHQPQCRQQWMRRENAKPEGQRRAVPQPPPAPYVNAHDARAAVATRKQPGGDGDGDDGKGEGDERKITTSNESVDAYNEAAYQVWCEQALRRCSHCQRSFTEEAYVSHRRRGGSSTCYSRATCHPRVTCGRLSIRSHATFDRRPLIGGVFTPESKEGFAET